MPDRGIERKPLFAVAQNYFLATVPGDYIKGLTVNDTKPSVPLLERTQELVKNAPRSITLTDMAAGTGISIAWLSRFSRDLIGDPGVKNVQALHDFLANVGK